MPMSEQVIPADNQQRLTWGRCIGMATLVLIGGAFLALWRPVYFAPPHLAASGVFYLVMAWLWIPALIILALRRPAGSWPLLIIGLVPMVIVSVLVSFLLALFFVVIPADCPQTRAPAGAVVYTCSMALMSDSRVTYVFEGAPGSPLVRLVSSELRTFNTPAR
jgi:hypothetical protein